MKKIIVSIVLIGLVGFLTVLVFRNSSVDETEVNTTENKLVQEMAGEVVAVADNLSVPWSLAFLPDGTLLATERNGNLRVFGVAPKTISVPGVVEVGEGGLLGIALHPDFVTNSYLYLYFTTQRDGQTINKIVRYVFDGTALMEERVIIDNIPGGTNHNGGRIAFGPDRMLYVTTGDAGTEDLAQDTSSLAGKILRVHEDGSIPADNPFNNAVYSYGHRNPQGLAWDSQSNLWETEHGRSGLRSGLDEVNFIEKGANYGWPLIEGDEKKEGMKTPVVHSGAGTTWAPSGIAYREGRLYFVGLRGQALYEAEILSGGKLGQIQTHFENTYGRLRGIAVGPDGGLYITTSNKDGRGDPFEGDDKILKYMSVGLGKAGN
jgi:glucose/arabinose dehydrogenase